MENSEFILLDYTKFVGFIYLQSRNTNTERTYQGCRKLRIKECSAITVFDSSQRN